MKAESFYLECLVEELKKKGVTKFHFSMAPGEFTPEQVLADKIHIIEAHLNGEYHELPPLGDSVRV